MARTVAARSIAARPITADPDLNGAWPEPHQAIDEERMPRLSMRQELMAIIEEHEAAEAKSIQAYQELTASGDPVVALLTGLMARDEETHHKLLTALAASVSDSPYWKSRGKDLSPNKDIGYLEEGEASRLAAMFATFLKGERTGQKHLKEIARRTREDNRGLYAMILDFMTLDSEKHQKVLAFLVDYLVAKEAAKGGVAVAAE
jgi:hypothetical protein